MLNHDRKKAVALHVELISLEQKSVDARHDLMEHQRGVHTRQGRPRTSGRAVLTAKAASHLKQELVNQLHGRFLA